jgi:hypothetical protein
MWYYEPSFKAFSLVSFKLTVYGFPLFYFCKQHIPPKIFIQAQPTRVGGVTL